MLKKLLKFFRFLLIGSLWSAVYLFAASIIVYYLWHFNLMSPADWQKISDFWNNNGVIKAAPDYWFFITLLLVVIFWFWGWRRLNRVDYLEIFLWPFRIYNRYIIRKYGHGSKRILLRNTRSMAAVIEDIKKEIAAIKPEAPQESSSIRSAVLNKLEDYNKKS